MHKLDNRELAAVLAGLRLLQETKVLPPDIALIASNGGTILEPLSNEGIDTLCERLNTEPDLGTIAITLEGGMVQNIVSDDKHLHGIDVLVIDYDTDGSDRTYPVQQFGYDPATKDWTADMGEEPAILSGHTISRACGIDLAKTLRRFNEEEPDGVDEESLPPHERAACAAGWKFEPYEMAGEGFWWRPCKPGEESNDPDDEFFPGTPIMSADTAKLACQIDGLEVEEAE